MVIVFSIDGMRPDGLRMADTPNMDRLREAGAWTDRAQTVMPSCTLPCHTSMMRGVEPSRHGITTNTFQPLVRPVSSIFDLATQHGLRCGMFYNWGPLRDLCDPESVATSVYVRAHTVAQGDTRVAEEAARSLAQDELDFAFVYLGFTDECGHMEGWMSPPYLEAIAHADRCVGRVLEGREADVLVLSDHGGHGRSHGTDMPEDMTIPWILSGPSARPGEIEGDVRVYDTAATVAHLLGLPQPREWDGRPILSAIL